MWAVEHHFLEDHALSSAPEVWLAAAAARTERIRIGHGIVCTPPGFAHPARVAERIGTLDQVSGGRVEFGTGESSSRMELEGFGVDVDTKRAAYLEAVEQICNMMVMTPYPGYDGEFFSMPCRNIVPKPAQKPHPPLWVAGKPDVAARHGMGCLGFNVVGGHQAKVMVDQYYRTLAEECVPIGHAVNANIAVLATLHCHERRRRRPAQRRAPQVLRLHDRQVLPERPGAPGRGGVVGGVPRRQGLVPGDGRQPDERHRHARTRSATTCARCRRPASTRSC